MKQKVDIFYSNIGGKIKLLAKIIAALGVVASVLGGGITGIGGFFMIVTAGDSWNSDAQIAAGFGTIGLSFVYLIGGILASWIWSWFMYGFGELIQKTCQIAEQGENRNHGQFN
ncbi:MAG: hypothetical protein FWD35_00630 [Oscillospiraceae bacterium]|nr:hypothetical protein [Oscillospiraceae bacterium]